MSTEKSMEHELHDEIRRFIEKTKSKYGCVLLDFDVAISWRDEEMSGTEVRVQEKSIIKEEKEG